MKISLVLLIVALLCASNGFGFMAAIFTILSLVAYFNRDNDGFGGPDKSGYA